VAVSDKHNIFYPLWFHRIIKLRRTSKQIELHGC